MTEEEKEERGKNLCHTMLSTVEGMTVKESFGVLFAALATIVEIISPNVTLRHILVEKYSEWLKEQFKQDSE